ncbi:RpiB/LacA/LacB family sugar-phosphate isomerase [Streptomyces cavernicola]|uniref:RpiB/LacA/LacB family sugar-phosphate isomerase n=1 Tax=Streptomyces cavernicola TaxID=3043613 RepID=A0ABT6SL43_9ACTN|nr:RpiB/LacA/LacB family sugar-phosphate isomerase [Streptomyces sp. B-S-A6]MDI3408917.1 RpiB/LacA/LacB family sugar-phosphate isomerase [Streptomyces sp. B-S-A6]
MVRKLRIAVGSDEAGRQYREALRADLNASNLVSSVTDVGVHGDGPGAYPEIATAAARLVAAGEVDRALLVCHTGLGVAIAANKVLGVRAACAHDEVSVRASVLSNNAQVLCLGQGIIGLAVARRLTAEWLTCRFDPDCSAAAKVARISALEQGHS